MNVEHPVDAVRLSKLIASGESNTVEFKLRLPPDHNVARLLSAFANVDGGFLLVGVADRDDVPGLTPAEAQAAVDRLSGIVESLVEGGEWDWEVGQEDVGGRKVAYVYIGPAPAHLKPVVTSRGEVFARENTRVVLANPPRRTPAATSPRSIRVFVAMSFREEQEPALVDYWNAMCRAAESCGLSINMQRIDLKEGDYEISNEIMAEIDAADVVIADFTLSSRNVYFELGYARGKGKRVIQTARKETALEFDVRNWRTLFYRNATELEEKLETALASLAESAG